jgi:hypothetical protein
MSLRDWSKATAGYGRKLVSSGLEGARSGREAFLHGGALAPFLSTSFQNALKPAAVGLCLGVLGTYPAKRFHSRSRAVGFGLLGGVIGFGLGFVWESRQLAASVASAVFGNIEKVRDEHWLEKHPIDFA